MEIKNKIIILLIHPKIIIGTYSWDVCSYWAQHNFSKFQVRSDIDTHFSMIFTATAENSALQSYDTIKRNAVQSAVELWTTPN